MRKLTWVLAWLCVAAWTAIAVFGYWIINLITGFAANNADKVGGDAEAIEFVNRLALLLQSIGEIAAVVLWLVVSLAILGIAWAIARLTAGSPASPPIDPPLKS